MKKIYNLSFKTPPASPSNFNLSNVKLQSISSCESWNQTLLLTSVASRLKKLLPKLPFSSFSKQFAKTFETKYESVENLSNHS